MKRALFADFIALLWLSAAGCAHAPQGSSPSSMPVIVGARRSSVQFESGAFAGVKDLEFLYVFNLGGTLTESSNYDAVPPVPPAYGSWRQIGPRTFEARYEYYATKAPSSVEEITSGGGWMPAGRGVFVETIEVSADGREYTATIQYEPLDTRGGSLEGGGRARAHGRKIEFSD